MASSVGASKMLPRAPIVELPTSESPSYLQKVVGKPSSISSELEEFRGIPYGSISARWEHSQLRTRLPSDVFDATTNGPKCPQPSTPNNSCTYQSHLHFPDDAESEFDCLNLLIVRPSKRALEQHGVVPDKTPLPVLVWLHGGGWAFGAATDPMWDPTRLVLRALQRGSPIIAVNINYRLNILGFAASTEILRSQNPVDIQGLNFGLRDQKVALEWIAHNIGAFGGDPDRVTLGGQSAGAVSVHCHLLEADSRPEKPLFRRVIMQSGALGTLGPNTLEAADETWSVLCEDLRRKTKSNHEEDLALLRSMPVEALVQAAAELQLQPFPAIVDNVTILQGNPFDRDNAVHLGQVGSQRRPSQQSRRRIDVLMGVTDWESGIFLSSPVRWKDIQHVFYQTYADSALRGNVMQAYGLIESASHEELQKAVVLFLNDSMFEIPVHMARKSLNERRCEGDNSKSSSVHSFHIEFGNPFPGPSQGVAHHCVELIYLFDAFHDALVQADLGSASSDGNPGNDSFISTESTMESSWKESPYKRTNVEMCHALQDHWLDFIVLDEYTSGKTSDDITVYGRDRATRTESLVDNVVWQKRSHRWDLSAEDIGAMARARDAILSCKV